MLARHTPNSTPLSRVVVTFACGHGERVPANRLSEVRLQVQGGATCSRCEADKNPADPPPA